MRILFFIVVFFLNTQVSLGKSAANVVDSLIQGLDDVIVSVNKFQQKQKQTGKVVTILTKKDILESGSQQLSQLLNFQAGIIVNNATSNFGTVQTTYFRGANSGRVLILIDGIPVYDPSFINNDFDLNLISIFQIERIEIYYGGQSTIYGSDAEAGVINIITNSATNNKLIGGSTTVQYGSFNNKRTTVNLKGSLKKISYDGKFNWQEARGFSAAIDTNSQKNFDKDGYRNSQVSLVVGYPICPEFKVKAWYNRSNYLTHQDIGPFIDDKDFQAKNNWWQAGIGGYFQHNKYKFQFSYQFIQTKRNYINDSNDIGGFAKYESDNFSSQLHYVDIYGQVNLIKNLDFLHGVDLRYNKFGEDYFSISDFGNYESKIPDSFSYQWSVYSTLFYQTKNQKLTIDLGGRFNRHSAFGNNTTYHLSSSYYWSKFLRIFGSISSSFKVPSLYQLFSFYGDSKLKPEISTTYELGLHGQVMRYNYKLTFFNRLVRNGLDFNYIDEKFYNFNKQEAFGLEWENQFKLLSNLSLQANYSFLNGRDSTQSRLSYKDTAYNYLLKRPQHKISVNIRWSIIKNLTIQGQWLYFSNRYDVGGYLMPDIRLNPYSLVNLQVQFLLNKHWFFSVSWQNIFNENYFETYGFTRAPRNILLGLTYNF